MVGSCQRRGELRLHFEHLLHTLILDNPDFKSIDESLTLQQKIELIGLANLLNHYHPGQYNGILGKAEGNVEGWSEAEIVEKLRSGAKS